MLSRKNSTRVCPKLDHSRNSGKALRTSNNFLQRIGTRPGGIAGKPSLRQGRDCCFEWFISGGNLGRGAKRDAHGFKRICKLMGSVLI